MFTRYTPPQLPATQAEKVAHPLHRFPPMFLIVFVVAASTTLQHVNSKTRIDGFDVYSFVIFIYH